MYICVHVLYLLMYVWTTDTWCMCATKCISVYPYDYHTIIQAVYVCCVDLLHLNHRMPCSVHSRTRTSSWAPPMGWSHLSTTDTPQGGSNRPLMPHRTSSMPALHAWTDTLSWISLEHSTLETPQTMCPLLVVFISCTATMDRLPTTTGASITIG